MQVLGPVDKEEAAQLLERSGELAALSDCLEAVSEHSHGRLALVRGEAGIGKTALLKGFCDELGPAVRILWASCDPLFAPRPLGPLLDVARVTDGELRTQVQGGAKPHDVALALMRELALLAPTVLVLEDVHWADEATLDVVRLVARRIDAVPALFVISFREEQLDRSHPLRIVLGELPSSRAVTRLQLGGLSREAVATLAQASGTDVDALYVRTAGNPFYVTEVLAARTDRVPDTVRDAVLARAARLSRPARALLDAVAVVPQRAELWLLEALAGSPLTSLDEGLSSGMLRADADGVAFRHELARLAVEESLGPDRRLVLNRRALGALAEPAAGLRDLARLAHHAEAANDAESVLRYAPAAAEHAAAVGAHREAGSQYARALRFTHALAPEARADLLRRFAYERYLTDTREEALQALDEALAIHRERGDVSKQGYALWLRSRLLVCQGRTDLARAAAHEAVAVLEQASPGRELARAYGALSHVSMLADEPEPTIEWGNRAISLAEKFGDAEALVQALNNIGYIELGRGIAGGREKLDRSLELAKQNALEPDVGRAYINLVAGLARRLEWGLAEHYLEPGIEYCREQGLETWLNWLVAARAGSELARGRWDDAAETATSIIQGPPDLGVSPRYRALCVLALARARRGDPGCWPLLDEALELAQSIGDLQDLAMVAAARAEAAWLEGSSEGVEAETRDAFELALEHQEPSFVGELAYWRWRAGLLTEPPADAHDLYRRQISGEWQEAARLWDEKGCPYEAALALADSNDANTLRRALDALRALGARPAAAIVTRRLRQLGERGMPRGPRALTRENPCGLTERQLEVLQLLAAGRRNSEIAERLVVSQKTVDHHVSAILGKLDVRTRGEASAKAMRLGLIAEAGDGASAA